MTINSPSGPVTCPDGQPCQVNCNAPNSCAGLIRCGTGPCVVSCLGLYSCAAGVDCNGSVSCEVYCDTDTCMGKITCGPGRCLIDCAADNGCGSVDCSTSCACLLYGREGQFPTSSCPSNCHISMGCNDKLPGCDSC